jgi:hypothetical protein
MEHPRTIFAVPVVVVRMQHGVIANAMTAKAKKFRAKYFATEFTWRCFYEQFGSKQVNNKFGRSMTWRG